MTHLELIEVATVFSEISGEAILKRRQKLFIELYHRSEEYKSFLEGLASLSVAINSSANLSVKVTINSARIQFSEGAGKVLYYLLEDNLVQAKRELHKLPHYLQVIISFVFSKRLLYQLTHEFLFDTLDNLQPLSGLLGGFITLPTDIYERKYSEKIISFSENSELQLPFAIVKRNKKHREHGRLFYLTKDAGGVTSNIPNKAVKDYLSKNCTLTSYGVIISLVFNSKKSRVKSVQIVVLSENTLEIKKVYSGKSDYYMTIRGRAKDYFKKPPQTIELFYKEPSIVNSFDEVIVHNNLANGNIVIHKYGIAILSNKPHTVRAKVVDYLLDSETFEPLGYVVSDSGKTFDVKCRVTEEVLDRGIDDLYINVKQTKFMGEIISTEFSSTLSNRYRTCALCGKTERLLTKYLCFTCNATLYKVAVASTKKLFEFDKIKPAISGTKFSVYKYDVEFTEESVGFVENLDLVRGKQLRLPYNWWDREAWLFSHSD